MQKQKPTRDDMARAVVELAPLTASIGERCKGAKLTPELVAGILAEIKQHIAWLVQTGVLPDLDWPTPDLTVDTAARKAVIGWIDAPTELPPLRTADDHRTVARATWDAMEEALRVYSPQHPPCHIVGMALGIYAALRVDNPGIAPADAMAAAAWQIADHVGLTGGPGAHPKQPPARHRGHS